jgi:DNA modification methylase
MTSYYDDGAVRLYLGDCREILPTLEAVDHVITDPPYSEHVHGKSRAGARVLDRNGFPCAFSREAEFGFDPMTEELRATCASEFARLARRWVLVFSDVESSGLWRNALSERGLDYTRTGAWIKEGATPQFTGDRPGVGFEAITICHPKGRKRWNGGGAHAVWSVPIVLNRGGRAERVHTTQKPENLLSRLVALFSDAGDVILDPFAGSGTTAVAAKRLGRRCVLIEREEKYCEVAAKRLAQGALDLFGQSA